MVATGSFSSSWWGVVLVCAPKRAPIFAINGIKRNSSGLSGLLWETKDNPTLTSDVPTPFVLQKSFLFLVI